MTFFENPYRNGDSLSDGFYYHDHWNNNPRSIRFECDRPTDGTWLDGDFPLICNHCQGEMHSENDWECLGCKEEFLNGEADTKLLQKPQKRTIPYMQGYRTGEQQLNCQRYCTTK